MTSYSLPNLRKRMTKIFNEFIRYRDKDLPCISCGIRRVEDAGHYWSTAQCPQASMRYYEKNVNGQCSYCNRRLEGNRQGYKKGLIKKYGEKVILELDVKRSSKQNPWRVLEYEIMIDHYKGKLKEIKRRY